MRTKRVMLRRGDRGAVLVIVAAFAIVAVTMLAVVVDLGDQRQERKEVSLSTDSAALAAAALADTESPALRAVASGTAVPCVSVGVREFGAENSEGFLNVQQVVDQYLGINGGSQRTDCGVVRTGLRAGYVLVSAREAVEYAVGPAIGVQGGQVAGTSVAAIDAGMSGGLRPIGLCATSLSLSVTNPAGFTVMNLRDLATAGSGGYSVGPGGYIVKGGERSYPRVRMPIDRLSGTSCGAGGGGSGNFGKVDFGGANNESCDDPGHFCKDLRDGYYAPITNPVKGNTGDNWSGGSSYGSYGSFFRNLMATGSFWAPVFNVISNPGNNAEMNVVFFAELRMLGYCVDGSAEGRAGTATPCTYPETGPDKAHYFDFEVLRILPFAGFTVPRNFDAMTRPPRLCAVDNELTLVSSNCPQLDSTEPPGGPVSPPPLPPTNNPPAASFSGTCSGLTCTFVDTSTDSDGTIASRLWDFGDGTTSTDSNPTKNYATAGTRTVTLTVSDDDGATSTSTAAATPTAPVCTLSIDPSSQIVVTEGSSSRTTRDPVSWTVTVTNPGACGSISGGIWDSGTYPAGSARFTLSARPPSAIMTFTLPATQPVPSSLANNPNAFEVRFFDGSVPRGNVAVLGTSNR